MTYTVRVNGKDVLSTEDRDAAEAEIDRHLPSRAGRAQKDIRLIITKGK